MEKLFKNLKKCRICFSKELDYAFHLKKIPLPEDYSKNINSAKNKPCYPLTILRCKRCKHVQQKEIINQQILWKKYTYFSGQTKAILKHFKEISDYIKGQVTLSKKDLVIDVGSNDGSLLKFFKNKCKVLGIDPADTVAKFAIKKNKVKTLIKYFDKNCCELVLKAFQKPKVITAFNVFAHTPSMNDFVKNVKKILHEDGIFVFEAQYLGDIINKNILGTFFHEHISHHSIYSLKVLFDIYQLKIIDIRKVNVQKGSIIGLVTHKNNKIKVKSSVKNFIQYEQRNKINSLSMLKKFKDNIRKNEIQALKLTNKYNKIIGYGAARSGPTLAKNFGLEHKIKYIFDDHPMKKNKYTPSSAIKILPTKKISNFYDCCIILAYLHSKKIIKKNLKFLKKGMDFLILFPKPKLINIKNYKKIIC